MERIKQILFELKNRKMVTWVSISGTALAIFMIMALFMSGRVKTLEISPVSNRNRIMTGQGIHDIISNSNQQNSSMGLSHELATKLYKKIDGIETISYLFAEPTSRDVSIDNNNLSDMTSLNVDNNFWKIYDFKFIAGRPFSQEEVESAAKVAIVTESMARKLYGVEDIVGKSINVSFAPYTVVGVIEDVNPLVDYGAIDFYVPYFILDRDPFHGKTNVKLLLKDNANPNDIKEIVEQRYKQLNLETENQDISFVYHKQPYTDKDFSNGYFGSNVDPDPHGKSILWWLMYGILILLPAINLGSMTRSRFKRRVSEIGIRRAFGAKRKTIIGQLFTENLIITFIGGAIGLLVSLLFMLTISQYFLSTFKSFSIMELSSSFVLPVITDLFDWKTFFIAIGICFILNIISSTLPAWQASRIEPAYAISQTR